MRLSHSMRTSTSSWHFRKAGTGRKGNEVIPDLGQRSQPVRYHRQGQAPTGFLGKIILAGGSGIFPENLACGGGLHESPRNRE